jgi:hypothetical protein
MNTVLLLFTTSILHFSRACGLISTLSTDLHLERCRRIKMVEQVLILGDRTVFLFGFAEHCFRSGKIKHEIRNHASLNEADPAM